jgi:hypothetical protein
MKITTKRSLTTPITILPFLATSLVSVNQEQHLGNVRRKGVRPRQSDDRSSCCPQGATTLVGPIAVVNIALPQMLHGQRRIVCVLRREQQVHRVRHQCIGVHRAAELLGQLDQPVQRQAVVLLGVKACRTGIAPLNHVPEHPGQAQPCAPRHRLVSTSYRH